MTGIGRRPVSTQARDRGRPYCPGLAVQRSACCRARRAEFLVPGHRVRRRGRRAPTSRAARGAPRRGRPASGCHVCVATADDGTACADRRSWSRPQTFIGPANTGLPLSRANGPWDLSLASFGLERSRSRCGSPSRTPLRNSFAEPVSTPSTLAAIAPCAGRGVGSDRSVANGGAQRGATPRGVA